MAAEYRFRAPSIGIMLAILLPGLAIGGVLLYIGPEWLGFLVTALFAFGTVPLVRALGLMEERTHRAAPDGLTLSLKPPVGAARERTVPWNRVTGLQLRTQEYKGTKTTRMLVGVEGEQELSILADYPGFAEWLEAVQRFSGKRASNR